MQHSYLHTKDPFSEGIVIEELMCQIRLRLKLTVALDYTEVDMSTSILTMCSSMVSFLLTVIGSHF